MPSFLSQNGHWPGGLDGSGIRLFMAKAPNRHPPRPRDVKDFFEERFESDGDCITTGQLRQLETVTVQCRRRREVPDERLSA